jgi:hypothetical protein
MRQMLHETVVFRVLTGFKAAVAEIAAQEHLTPSCYLRRLALRDVEGRRSPCPQDATASCGVRPEHGAGSRQLRCEARQLDATASSTMPGID